MSHEPTLRAHLEPPGGVHSYRCLQETDAALELCEDAILVDHVAPGMSGGPVALEDFDICEGLDASRIEA